MRKALLTYERLAREIAGLENRREKARQRVRDALPQLRRAFDGTSLRSLNDVGIALEISRVAAPRGKLRDDEPLGRENAKGDHSRGWHRNTVARMINIGDEQDIKIARLDKLEKEVATLFEHANLVETLMLHAQRAKTLYDEALARRNAGVRDAKELQAEVRAIVGWVNGKYNLAEWDEGATQT